MNSASGTLVGPSYNLRGGEWRWSVSDNGALSGGGRKARSVSIEANAPAHVADELFDALEADALAGTPGTLTAQGVWTAQALHNGHELDNIDKSQGIVDFTLKMLLPDGCWRHVTRVELAAHSAKLICVDGIDYTSESPQDGDLDYGLDIPPIPAAPIVAVQPASVSVLPSTRACIWARVIGYHLSYQWQVMAGSIWIDVEGATSSALALDRGITGTYRLVATDQLGRSVASEAASVTLCGFLLYGLDVPPTPAAPTIERQPGAEIIGTNTRAALYVVAHGYHLSYSWEELSGESWEPCEADGADTSAIVLEAGQTGEFRCTVTDAFGRSVQSEIGAVTAIVARDYPLDYATSATEARTLPYVREESHGSALDVIAGDIAGGDYGGDYYAPGELDMAAHRALSSFEGYAGFYGDARGFDYGVVLFGAPFEVESASGALLRIMFHGICDDPYVLVGGNRYMVDANANAGETIVIDPTRLREIGGSVYKQGRYGYLENLFDKRGRGAPGSGTYVFERIAAGSHRASWPQTMDVSIDVIEERGTPPWSYQ